MPRDPGEHVGYQLQTAGHVISLTVGCWHEWFSRDKLSARSILKAFPLYCVTLLVGSHRSIHDSMPMTFDLEGEQSSWTLTRVKHSCRNNRGTAQVLRMSVAEMVRSVEIR